MESKWSSRIGGIRVHAYTATKSICRYLWPQGVLLLAPPFAFVLWLVFSHGGIWIASMGADFAGSAFAANTIIIGLVFLGHIMTLINLVFYLESGDAHGLRDGSTDAEKRNVKRVRLIAIIICVLIAVFLVLTSLAFCGIQIPYFSFGKIVEFNHWFLLGILIMFICMDWWELKRVQRGAGGDWIEETVALLYVWLVSVPSILVTVLAIVLHWSLVRNSEVWFLIIDKPEQLSGEQYGYLHPPLVSPSSQERPFFDLFFTGLNVGLIMASIIVSQLSYFVINVISQRRTK